MKITTDEVSEYDWDERRNVEVDLVNVPEILKDLGIVTDNMEESREWLAADPELEECVCYVGASYNNTSHSGPSALYLSRVHVLRLLFRFIGGTCDPITVNLYIRPIGRLIGPGRAGKVEP